MGIQLEIREQDIGSIAELESIPISFRVENLFQVELGEPDQILLHIQTIDAPWIKDYDAIPNNAPSAWPTRWDIRKWGYLKAFASGQFVAGCVIALDTEGIHTFDSRNDIAVLWDIRVRPDYRQQHIGSALIEDACRWARARGCTNLIVETQNNNVPACRLYDRNRFRLTAANWGAYPAFPDEIELIWERSL